MLSRRWVKIILIAFNAVAMAAVDIISRLIKTRLTEQADVCEIATPVAEGKRLAAVTDEQEKPADAPVSQETPTSD